MSERDKAQKQGTGQLRKGPWSSRQGDKCQPRRQTGREGHLWAIENPEHYPRRLALPHDAGELRTISWLHSGLFAAAEGCWKGVFAESLQRQGSTAIAS